MARVKSKTKKISNHFLSAALDSSGISRSQLIKLLGVGHAQFYRIVHSGQKMSLDFIYRLSKLTNSAPRFWIYLQNDRLYQKYLRRRKAVIKIPMLVPRVKVDSGIVIPVGRLIESNLLQMNLREVSQKMRIAHGVLRSIISGSTSISPSMALKLGVYFKTDAKYWLDVQSDYEFNVLFEARPAYTNLYGNDLRRFHALIKPERSASTQKVISPMAVLMNNFIKPSKIPLSDWLKAIGITPKHCRVLEVGRSTFTPSQILRICRAFNTKPSYWIEIGNRFLIAKARKTFSRASVDPLEKPTKSTSEMPMQPGKMLADHFLKPMHITIREFAKHIGVKETRMFGLTAGYVRMDFEMAIRVGEATGMGAKFWIDLQTEYDILKYENQYRSV